jgi:hypothetical protein
LNGFEYSSFVFLLVICLGLQLTSTAHIVDKFKYIILVIFAGVISILQWLFIVQINFKNWNSSISLIQYTLFKHSSFGGNAPVPLGGLASGDSSISFLQSLIRVVFKTSLLFPYDLIQNFTNGAGHLDFTLKSIVFFTSFGLTSMVVMFLLKRKISILLFISIFLIWIYSIKSYAYHHVHIIGTALIFYLIFCLLMIPKELMSDNRS